MKVFSLQWKIDLIDLWQIAQYYEYIEWGYCHALLLSFKFPHIECKKKKKEKKRPKSK